MLSRKSYLFLLVPKLLEHLGTPAVERVIRHYEAQAWPTMRTDLAAFAASCVTPRTV